MGVREEPHLIKSKDREIIVPGGKTKAMWRGDCRSGAAFSLARMVKNSSDNVGAPTPVQTSNAIT